MTTGFTCRQFLQSGLVLGAGLSMSGFTHILRQNNPSDDAYLPLTGSIRNVHDPVIIEEDGTFYLFSTGRGIPMKKSADMIDWERAFPPLVFPNMPEWITEKIPGQNDIWAPDISYFNGKFHLYYSVSLFGRNTSVIGLATNKTLNNESDDFEWVDEGLVLESTAANNYNCIDPNLILDEDGVPWLAFGSFWSGLKMRRLDLETGKPSEEDTRLYPLAQRFINSGAVEAPFIIRHEDYYYLFASFDSCCRGVDSTYYVVVGRSENVTGPYVDREGVEMTDGGGTQVTFPTDRWKGPGHSAMIQKDGVDYIVHHAYDADANGAFSLRIAPITWDDEGWPLIAEPES